MARFWSMAGHTIAPKRVDHAVRNCFLRRTSMPITTWKKRGVVAVLGAGDRLPFWAGTLRTGAGPRTSKRVTRKSICNLDAHCGNVLASAVAPEALVRGGKLAAQSTRDAWPSL